MKKRNITTQEQAREYAIDWQQWAGEQDLYMSEIVEWGAYFEELAERFDLYEEYHENAII